MTKNDRVSAHKGELNYFIVVDISAQPHYSLCFVDWVRVRVRVSFGPWTHDTILPKMTIFEVLWAWSPEFIDPYGLHSMSKSMEVDIIPLPEGSTGGITFTVMVLFDSFFWTF